MTFSLHVLMITLKKFINYFNSFSHNIKFTYEFVKENKSILDLIFNSSNGKRMTSLYRKPTDFHQYLHYKSSYLEQTKRFMLRFKLTSCFLKRYYLKIIVYTEMKKILGDNSKNVNNQT